MGSLVIWLGWTSTQLLQLFPYARHPDSGREDAILVVGIFKLTSRDASEIIRAAQLSKFVIPGYTLYES